VGAHGERIKKDLLQPFDLGGWQKQTGTCFRYYRTIVSR
jgi:hypothetical protein